MKSIWASLLIKIVKYLTSAEFINLVKKLVLFMNKDESKTGDEKRIFVLNELKKQSFVVSSSLTSLAIEAVVSYLKIKGLK